MRELIILNLMQSVDPFNKGMRWTEIRTAVANEFGDLSIDPHAFTMRVSRALKRLEGEELILKYNLGHKQTYYKLNEDTFHEFLSTYSDLALNGEWIQYYLSQQGTKSLQAHAAGLIIGTFTSPGLFDLTKDIKYEDYKNRIMEKVEEILEPYMLQLWNKLGEIEKPE